MLVMLWTLAHGVVMYHEDSSIRLDIVTVVKGASKRVPHPIRPKRIVQRLFGQLSEWRFLTMPVVLDLGYV